MPFTGERASSPIGSASSSGEISVSAALGTNWRAIGSCARSLRSISASISGVIAIAIDSAASASRGSGVDQAFALEGFEGAQGWHGGAQIA